MKLSEVYEDNITFRFDSEFFKKEYLEIDRIIEQNQTIKLDSLSDWITQGANPKFSEGDIPSLTGRNINSGKVSYENSDIINVKEYNNLSRFQLQLNDILITLKGKGAVGKVGYVTEDKKAIFSRNIGLIRVKNKNISSLYIYLFLISKFGIKVIEKGETGGTGQTTLTTTYLKHIFIPVVSNHFQLKLKNLIEKVHKYQLKSKSLYKEAENILLKELDLLDFEPTQENIAIKTLEESFLAIGRLDSEYYQPKYDEILEKIKKVDYAKLGNIVSIMKSVEPGSKLYNDNGIEFIRVSNLTKFGLTKSDIYLPYKFFEEEALKKLQPKKDTILLSKDGTVGIAYTIKDETNIVTSGAILHLTLTKKDVLPEYLSLVLNSMVVQMQSERDAGGSIIKHWRVKEIENILIPIIDLKVQKKISEKIKTSFQLKSESIELLALAKRAVEVAIEEGEEVAIKIIKESSDVIY